MVPEEIDSNWELLYREHAQNPAARIGLNNTIKLLLKIDGFDAFVELANATNSSYSSTIEDYEIHMINNYCLIRQYSAEFEFYKLKSGTKKTAALEQLKRKIVHAASTWWAVMPAEKRQEFQKEMKNLERGISPLMTNAISPPAWGSPQWKWYFEVYLQREEVYA